MAIGIKSSYVEENYSPAEFRKHKIALQLYPLRKCFRQTRLLFELSPSNNTEVIPCTSRTFNSAEKSHFRSNGWVFVENFLNSDFHRLLMQSWPPFYHFRPMHQIHKSYDNDLINRSLTHRNYPALNVVKEYFSSKVFEKHISNLCADKTIRRFDRMLAGRAYGGSRLAPHLDQISENTGHTGINETINVIYYVEGTGGKSSGGTCIMHGNEWTDIVFEPTNLTNSILIYKAGLLFHGFPRIRSGAFRHTLIFNMIAQN